MGGFFKVLLCGFGAVLLYGSGHTIAFWFSVLFTVVSFWLWGVMHNFAMESAKVRRQQSRENYVVEGRSTEEIAKLDRLPIQIEPRDAGAIPDGLAVAHMIATLAGFGMLAFGIYLRIR